MKNGQRLSGKHESEIPYISLWYSCCCYPLLPLSFVAVVVVGDAAVKHLL